jgi:hypothetical protein
MWVSAGGAGTFDDGKEQDVPVISLCFDYEGVRVRAADRRRGIPFAVADNLHIWQGGNFA